MSLPAFNRVLSRHLALALHSGAACDENLVERCYRAAAYDVGRPGPELADPLATDIHMLCVARDLDVLRQHESKLRGLSLPEASAEIFRLLNPELRVMSRKSEDFQF